MHTPIVLTLRTCCVCLQRVAFFNNWGIHCRELQGPTHTINMSRNESRVLAALLYPPGFWRSRREVIETMYPGVDGGPDFANSSLAVSTMKIRKKIIGTKLKIICGSTRGLTLQLPVVVHET